MYLDSLEFLEEEREAWAPFEALADLTDDQLSMAVDGAHGWSGRQLMAHLVAWQEVALAVATELAVNETSPTKVSSPTPTGRRAAARPSTPRSTPAGPGARSTSCGRRFRKLPGELRGYLTVVPETRWLKHADHLRFFQDGDDRALRGAPRRPGGGARGGARDDAAGAAGDGRRRPRRHRGDHRLPTAASAGRGGANVFAVLAAGRRRCRVPPRSGDRGRCRPDAGHRAVDSGVRAGCASVRPRSTGTPSTARPPGSSPPTAGRRNADGADPGKRNDPGR